MRVRQLFGRAALSGGAAAAAAAAAVSNCLLDSFVCLDPNPPVGRIFTGGRGILVACSSVGFDISG